MVGTRGRRVEHAPALSAGSVCEYMVHLRYIVRKKIGRTRASAARGCANAAASGHAAAH